MTQDLRVRKTEQAIQTAFWQCLAHQPFAHITVATLIQDAHIGKATFYNHYVDKYALARTLITESLRPVAAMFAARLATGDIGAMFAPLPPTIPSAHLRLLATIHTPELDFDDCLHKALLAVFTAALRRQRLLLAHPGAVGDCLATTCAGVFKAYLLGTTHSDPAAMRAELQEIGYAITALFPAQTKKAKELP